MDQKTLVSIVLLNWNGKKYIFQVLDSLTHQIFKDFEVIIVDNGSTDGSLEEVRNLYPDYQYILNGRNLGFAVGMNVGIEASLGEYVVPLNQDVFLDKDFLLNAVDTMKKKSDIGAVGPCIFTWDSSGLTDQIQKGEGGEFIIKKWIQGKSKVNKQPLFYTFGPSGCCPIFRKKMLDDLKQKTGYFFDPLYETGWEDMDLYFRMQWLGWTCLFNRSVKAWHVGSGSVGGNATFLSKSPDYQKRIIRNRWYLIIKNLPFAILIRILPWVLFFEICLPAYLLLKAPKALPSYFKAIRDVSKHFAALLKKRWSINIYKKISSKEMYKFFGDQ